MLFIFKFRFPKFFYAFPRLANSRKRELSRGNEFLSRSHDFISFPPLASLANWWERDKVVGTRYRRALLMLNISNAVTYAETKDRRYLC